MSQGQGLHDPDGWRERWLSLHPSDRFTGELARLAIRSIEDPHSDVGPGSEVLEFDEGGERFEVRVNYLVEQFPKGRVFHVLSMLSEGDPLPLLDR